MRAIPAVALTLLLAACAQAPISPPEPEALTPAPVAEASGLCGNVAYVALPSARQNASLAGEYSRAAEAAETPERARDAYCAATVYLRWLLAHDPTFTGSDPDDRHLRRMADAHEFFAGLPEADRRAHLDSALDLRQRADDLRRELALPFDAWASDLREGAFFLSHADAYEDASRRQYDAFDRAFQAAPEQIDDWYLRQLVILSAEWTESCEERAEYLGALAAHVDDARLKDYVEALAVCTPPPEPIAPVRPLVESFATGDYADCEPAAETRQLVGLSVRYPDLVTEAGGDPEAIVDALLDCVVHPTTAEEAYPLFVRSWRRGDVQRAEDYFTQALALPETDAQRADLLYTRAASEYGDVDRLLSRARALHPSHGPTLYLQASRLAKTIGTPRSVQQQAAYWCLADAFQEVAATGDPRVADNARQSIANYNRAAPTRESYIFSTDWKPGDTIRARSGGISCTTRVR